MFNFRFTSGVCKHNKNDTVVYRMCQNNLFYISQCSDAAEVW